MDALRVDLAVSFWASYSDGQVANSEKRQFFALSFLGSTRMCSATRLEAASHVRLTRGGQPCYLLSLTPQGHAPWVKMTDIYRIYGT